MKQLEIFHAHNLEQNNKQKYGPVSMWLLGSGSFPRSSRWGMKLTTDLHLMPLWRAIWTTPLSPIFSWCWHCYFTSPCPFVLSNNYNDSISELLTMVCIQITGSGMWRHVKRYCIQQLWRLIFYSTSALHLHIMGPTQWYIYGKTMVHIR
jgi:hypothetical protein